MTSDVDNQIMNGKDFLQYTKGLDKIYVAFHSQEEYAQEEIFLQKRFEKSIIIPGTQKLHALIPFSKNDITKNES